MRIHEIYEAANDVATVHGYILSSTDKAYRVQLYNSDISVWIPRSQMKPLSARPSRAEFDNKYTNVHQDPVTFKVVVGFKIPLWLLSKNNIGMHMIHHWKQERHVQVYDAEDKKYLVSVAAEARQILEKMMKVPVRKANHTIIMQRQHELESSYDRAIPKDLWNATFYETPLDYRIESMISDAKSTVSLIEREVNEQHMGLDAIDKMIRRLRMVYTELLSFDAKRP